MPQVTLDLSLDEIKALVLQLPPEQLLALVEALEERAETIALMRLAETGFREWNEPEEDIYDAQNDDLCKSRRFCADPCAI